MDYALYTVLVLQKILYSGSVKKLNILEIIAKKRDKKELSKEEINYFVTNYTNGNIADYQASALIMAIYINGMSKEEITNLTLAMAYSGEVLDLSEFGIVVDKHSTGGIGDKVTLILAPIIASLGIPIAKMSGRGLGYTGGTIDKIESIPGYQTNIDIKTFKENVKKLGVSLIGQTLNLAPADKKIYALRDATATTESIPLISSSIMSKKIAAGANKIVLDVTCGSGAFMKNLDDAVKLAETMKNIGKLAEKETICVITSMEEPLGEAVGNSLEVIEAIDALNGKMKEDVKQVVLTLGAYMIKLAGKGEDIEENKRKMLEQIQTGKALAKFKELVQNQNGDISYIDNPNLFKKAKYILPVVSEKAGYIKKLDAKNVGEISVNLGAGRIKKEDEIDEAVGIILKKRIGDKVEVGEILGYIHANDEAKGKCAVSDLLACYEISSELVQKPECILKIL